MLLTDNLCHSASIIIGGSASAVFGFIKEGGNLGKWAFGSWDTQLFRDDIFVGNSLFDSTKNYIRLVARPEMRQVDFEVGSAPDRLLPRIVARVFPGEMLGLGEAESMLSMISWRTAGVSDERWRLTCGAHEAEVFRLRHVFDRTPKD